MKTNSTYAAQFERLLDDLRTDGIVTVPLELMYRFYDVEKIGRGIWRDLADRIKDKIDDPTARIWFYKADWGRVSIFVDSDQSDSDWNIWTRIEVLTSPSSNDDEHDPSQGAKIKVRTIRY